MNRVLIVAGDQATGTHFQGVLSQSGFQTAVVWSSDQMVDFCRQHSPDIAVVDLDVPGDSIWAGLQIVKGLGDLANLPIVGLSTGGEPETLDQARSYGFAAVFPKNEGPTKLLNTLKNMTEQNQNPTTEVSAPKASVSRDESLNRLLEITSEVVNLTKDLKRNLDQFGNDGPELFSYIENSGEAIRTKLGSLQPNSLHDKELRHDFRNMIGSVTGFAELIMMEPTVTPESNQGLGRLRECSKIFVDILDQQKTAAVA